MIAFVLLTLATAAFAQYPYQIAPGSQQGYNPQQGYTQQIQHQYQPQQQQQNYQSQPQAYQPQPQQQYQPAPQTHNQNGAAVHYVNIGPQLQGDYKFGYDTGRGNDGQSFREETRLPDGSVQGAYGYVDANGKQRIVRYTAGKDGYKAEGDVGPDGVPQGSSPGPAPQAPAQPAQHYNSNNYGGNNNNYGNY